MMSGDIPEAADEHFNDRADLYESMIMKIVYEPGIFFSSVLDFIPSGSSEILELGSGTGLVTGMIMERNPSASVTCVDKTPEMIEVALKKPLLTGVRMIEGDFCSVWPEGSFDVVVTTLCLHHLNDRDRREVIRKVHDSLNDGGVFVNGDVFRPESLQEESEFNRRWRDYMIKNGLSETEAKAMIEKRKNSYAFLDTYDGYGSKLREAGFEEIRSPYINKIYGVFVAIK